MFVNMYHMYNQMCHVQLITQKATWLCNIGCMVKWCMQLHCMMNRKLPFVVHTHFYPHFLSVSNIGCCIHNLPTAMLNSTTSPALREKSPCKSRSEKTISSSTSSLSGKVKTIFPCSGSFCRFAADLLKGRSTVPWYLPLLTSSNFTVPSGSFSTRTATSLPCLESVSS